MSTHARTIRLPAQIGLSVIEGPDQGLSRNFVGQTSIRIGRSRESEFLLTLDKKVSRNHLRLEARGSGYVIAEIKPDNPVLVNGTPAGAGVRLRDRDVLTLGSKTRVKLALSAAMPALEAAPVPPAAAALPPASNPSSEPEEPCMVRLKSDVEFDADFLETCYDLERPVVFHTELGNATRRVEDEELPAKEVVLRGIGGPARGWEIPLDNREVHFVGRNSPPASVAFPEDDSLARNHFRIEYREGVVHLAAATSKSPTLVNGSSVPSAILEDGDEVSAGRCRWTLLTPTEVTLHEVAVSAPQSESTSVRTRPPRPVPAGGGAPAGHGPGMPPPLPKDGLAATDGSARILVARIVSGPHAGLRCVLEEGQSALIGSASSCVLALPLESGADPVHAGVTFRNRQIKIMRPGNAQPLALNGSPLESSGTSMLPATLRLGGSDIAFELRDASAPHPPGEEQAALRAMEILEKARRQPRAMGGNLRVPGTAAWLGNDAGSGARGPAFLGGKETGHPEWVACSAREAILPTLARLAADRPVALVVELPWSVAKALPPDAKAVVLVDRSCVRAPGQAVPVGYLHEPGSTALPELCRDGFFVVAAGRQSASGHQDHPDFREALRRCFHFPHDEPTPLPFYPFFQESLLTGILSHGAAGQPDSRLELLAAVLFCGDSAMINQCFVRTGMELLG